MKQGEHGQDAYIDLIGLLALLWILELGGEEDLREFATRVFKWSPSFCGQLLCEGLERDKALLTTIFMRIINLLLHDLKKCPTEW